MNDQAGIVLWCCLFSVSFSFFPFHFMLEMIKFLQFARTTTHSLKKNSECTVMFMWCVHVCELCDQFHALYFNINRKSLSICYFYVFPFIWREKRKIANAHPNTPKLYVVDFLSNHHDECGRNSFKLIDGKVSVEPHQRANIVCLRTKVRLIEHSCPFHSLSTLFHVPNHLKIHTFTFAMAIVDDKCMCVCICRQFFSSILKHHLPLFTNRSYIMCFIYISNAFILHTFTYN